MSELIIKDICPHCSGKTIVCKEGDYGVIPYDSCEHCKKKIIKKLPWEKRKWHLARALKPVDLGE